MRLKLYRARNMAEAMARVRSELGVDTLILGTRRVAEGIEVTAALEDEPASAPVRRSQDPALGLDDVLRAIEPENRPAPRRRTGTELLVAAGPARQRQAPAAPDPDRIAALAYHGVPTDLAATLCHDRLDSALQRALPFGSLNLALEQRPLLLTGPPGAGKTLTTARLATRLVMAKVTPLVITADAKRAGATEQLAAFTRLLGIELVVASHPVTLGRALARRQGGAPVLIDAPGTDPFDPAQVAALRASISAAGAVAALVLPAGLDPAEAADIAVGFAEAGATLLVVTRVDLARRLGGILAAAAASRLPLTEVGIGPGAADGLVPLTPTLLATRLMQTGTPRHAIKSA